MEDPLDDEMDRCSPHWIIWLDTQTAMGFLAICAATGGVSHCAKLSDGSSTSNPRRDDILTT